MAFPNNQPISTVIIYDQNGNEVSLGSKVATYTALADVAGPTGGGGGGTNKAMVSLFNPSASGKTVKLWKVHYYPIVPTGTSVIIDTQLRRITSHSAGTAVTPGKHDLSDGAAAAAVISEPTVGGGALADRIAQITIQSNTTQGASLHTFRFGDQPAEKPIILREDQGVVIHQVSNNGTTFAVGFTWTEE